jgi:hypothetical protein
MRFLRLLLGLAVMASVALNGLLVHRLTQQASPSFHLRQPTTCLERLSIAIAMLDPEERFGFGRETRPPAAVSAAIDGIFAGSAIDHRLECHSPHCRLSLAFHGPSGIDWVTALKTDRALNESVIAIQFTNPQASDPFQEVVWFSLSPQRSVGDWLAEDILR